MALLSLKVGCAVSDPIDFVRLASELLDRADTLVSMWLPGGKRNGAEWECADLSGGHVLLRVPDIALLPIIPIGRFPFRHQRQQPFETFVKDADEADRDEAEALTLGALRVTDDLDTLDRAERTEQLPE